MLSGPHAMCHVGSGQAIFYILVGEKYTLFVLNRSYRVLIKGIPLAIYALIILLGSFTMFGNKRSVTLLRETASPLGDLCIQLQLQLRCVTMHIWPVCNQLLARPTLTQLRWFMQCMQQ